MFLLTQTYSPRSVPKGRNRPLEEAPSEKKRRSAPKKVEIGKISLPFKQWLIYPIVAGVILALLMAANSYHQNLALSSVTVKLSAGAEHPFLDDEGIIAAIVEEGDTALIGKRLDRAELLVLENKLKESPFVLDAELYKNFQGVLTAEVALRQPMARLINNEADYIYLDVNGIKFPDTELHSAHSLLVRGDFDETVNDTFACSTVSDAISVMQFIHADPFWNAQISDMIIRQSGELLLLPQVGNLEIEFGYPVRIEEKFALLQDFYRQAIPKVGWNYYKSVSLKFKGQVVAKK
ncbi:MAG: cell division protein FtsQ/DivIB [Bacteroidia bacterium]